MQRGWMLGSAALVAALLVLGGLGLTRLHPSMLAALPDATILPPKVEGAVAPPEAHIAGEAVAPVARTPMDSTSTTLTALRGRYARSSLRGTNPDGEIRLDANGKLRLDAALVHRFEHFLSLIGEFELTEIRNLLQAQLRDEFGDAVAAQAISAFDHYLALREAIAATELADDLDTRLQQLQVLRREHFGLAADAMFGAEEDEIAYSLARQELLRDASLGPEERAAALAQLEASRDPQQHVLQRDATTPQWVNEQTRQFDALQIDPTTRAAERRALWGEEAAQRLAALDAERAAWDARVGQYQRERQALLARPDLDTNARQHALDALRLRRFDAAERQRIEALEAVGALPPGG